MRSGCGIPAITRAIGGGGKLVSNLVSPAYSAHHVFPLVPIAELLPEQTSRAEQRRRKAGSTSPGAGRVDRWRAVDHVVVDAVLGIGRVRLGAVQPGQVRLVLAEQQLRAGTAGAGRGEQLQGARARSTMCT